MSTVNLFTREVGIRIVYFGPSFAGKSSSLQFVHRSLRPDSRGQLVLAETGVDRTLSFDCLPVNLPKVRGYSIRILLCTVPGVVEYNSTRKQVLAGADGVVFVVDSQRGREGDNLASFENLRDNLTDQGLRLDALPHVFQWNKRDLPDALPVDELHHLLNLHGVRGFESVATSGAGVFEALTSVTTLAIADLRQRGVLEASLDPLSASLSPPAPGPDASIERQVKALSETATDGTTETPPLPLTTVVRAAATPFAASPAPQRVTSSPPTPGERRSGPPPSPVPSPSRPSLAALLPESPARSHAAAAELELARGNFTEAVRIAAQAFAEVARPRSTSAEIAPVLHALMLGLDGRRYLRFCEAAARADQGLCTQEDALFAVFFLVDAALD